MPDRNLEIALRIKADLESARKQLDDLNKSVKATGDNSKSSQEKLGALGDRIGEMEAEAADANKTLGQTGAVADVAAGKTKNLGSQVAQLAANLKNGNLTSAAGNITKLSGAMDVAAVGGGAFVGVMVAGVAALALLAVGAFKGSQETERLRVALIATGGAAGESASSLNRQAVAVGIATGRYGDARKAIELLTTSGKEAGAGLAGLATQAINMSIVTGESVDKSVAKILEIGDRPSAAIAKLNEQYHFLTASQYAQIAAMEAEGNIRGAARLANQLDAQAMAERAADVQANAGLLERAAQGVKKEWDKAWDSIKGIGRTAGLGDQVAGIEAQIKALTTPHLDRAGNLVQGQFNDQVEALQAQLKDLRRQQYEAGLAGVTKSIDAQANVDAIAARQRTAAFQPADVKRDNALKQAASDRLALMYGVVDPAEKARIEQTYTNQVKAANDAYAAATKVPKTAKGPDTTRAALAAQQQLLQMLGDEQAKIDPAAAAWNEYFKARDKANNAAVTATSLSGANIAAINGQRDAVIAVAAAVRDAAIDKLVDKDREAFEKLRDSLKGVDGISLGNVRAQIAQLNDELNRKSITGEEYRSTVELALNQGVKKLPTYEGVDAQVAGPFGELDKLDIQQKKLQDAYAAALNLLNQQHDAKLRLDESFVARENALFAEHAANLKQIDDARIQVMLQGISGSFAQGAAAIKQGLGEQSTAYKAAFALQKAAAIAMAIVNMQLDISQASSKGWPANIGLIAKAVAEGMTILGNIRSTKLATGGEIHGPGTGTSDSVPIWASDGEFMQQEAAVSYYGLDFMHAVNNRTLPRYATGGPIGVTNNTPRLSAPAAIRAPSGMGSLVVSPVSVVIHSNGGDQATAKQSTGSDGSQLLEVFMNAAAAEARPGGKIARTLDQAYVMRRKGNNYG